MIETKDIKKMVAHIVRRDKGIADTNIMHPAREWFTGLGISTLIVLIGTWFSFYMYMFYQTEMSKEVVITEQVVPYNASIVSSALEIFATKENTYNEILGNKNINTVTPVLVEATTTILIDPEEEIPEGTIDPIPVIDKKEVVMPTLAP